MDTTGYRVLKVLFFLVWIIAILNAAAEYWYWYWRVLWFDIPMHFIGGVWLGLAGIWLWRHTRYLEGIRNRIQVPNIVIVLVAGIVIGCAWESYEFIVWKYSGKGFPDEYVADLQLDLIMDTLGAVASLAVYKFLKKRE